MLDQIIQINSYLSLCICLKVAGGILDKSLFVGI